MKYVLDNVDRKTWNLLRFRGILTDFLKHTCGLYNQVGVVSGSIVDRIAEMLDCSMMNRNIPFRDVLKDHGVQHVII